MEVFSFTAMLKETTRYWVVVFVSSMRPREKPEPFGTEDLYLLHEKDTLLKDGSITT